MVSHDTMNRLSQYIVESGGMVLPEKVAEKAKHHILDTIAAMVSGVRLKPGELILKFIRTQGGTQEAQVIGADFLTTAIHAAMANGFTAHADETDDQHGISFTHPGSAVVPAALAMGELENVSGEAFLKSIVLGYDICCRIGRMMVSGGKRPVGHSSHAVGGLFGATAASAALLRLSSRQVRHALAYAGQQASGVTSWTRDEEHVEKAFVFSGMPARNAVTAALFVHQGFTGEEDIFSGEGNFLEALCQERDALPGWIDNLGSHYEVMETNIKRFPVGFPLQATAEAMTLLIREHKLSADRVKRLDVCLPPRAAKVVDNSPMPDVNCQYIMAAMLLDGKLSFEASHSYERMADPKVREVRTQVKVIGDQRLAEREEKPPGMLRAHLADGRILEKEVLTFKGSADNPLNRDEVAAKAIDLIQDILGKVRSAALIQAIWGLDRMKSVRELRPLLKG